LVPLSSSAKAPFIVWVRYRGVAVELKGVDRVRELKVNSTGFGTGHLPSDGLPLELILVGR
jgi:hypothetical protein